MNPSPEPTKRKQPPLPLGLDRSSQSGSLTTRQSYGPFTTSPGHRMRTVTL